MNLPNNHKAHIFRLRRFKFLASGDGNDDDIPKLPEECLKLEVFWEVSVVLVSVDQLLILSGEKIENKSV